MTPKQQLFADQYLIDRNATQAAIRCGYSAHTAKMQGSRLMTYDDICNYITEKSKSVAEKLGIDATYVLGSFKKVAERSMQAEPVLNRDGEETGEYTFNAPGANKALEMLGKHLKILGDDDKTKVQTNVTIQVTQF